MTPLPWAAGALAAGIALALAAGRPRAARSAPRLAASASILTLAGIALMPPLLLACAAAALGSASPRQGGHTAAGICVVAGGFAGPGPLALYGLAAVLAARTVVLAARALRAGRRAELRGLALAGATPGGWPAPGRPGSCPPVSWPRTARGCAARGR